MKGQKGMIATVVLRQEPRSDVETDGVGRSEVRKEDED